MAGARARRALPAAAPVMLAALLSGCGNAYERLYVGPWVAVAQVATATPGVPATPSYVKVVPIAPGTGREIGRGSVVLARVTNVSRPKCEDVDFRVTCIGAKDAVRQAWFWTGRSTGGVDLGSAELREAFVGRRAGERFFFQEPKRDLYLPQQMFLLDYALTPEGTTVVKTDLSRVSISGSPDARFEVEVLRVCEGAVPYRREGVLKQWGVALKLWEGQAFQPFERYAVVHWVALETQCDSPRETLRFAKGPALDPKRAYVLDFPRSYKSAMEHGRITETPDPLAKAQ